jgi:hypothetical protein
VQYSLLADAMCNALCSMILKLALIVLNTAAKRSDENCYIIRYMFYCYIDVHVHTNRLHEERHVSLQARASLDSEPEGIELVNALEKIRYFIVLLLLLAILNIIHTELSSFSTALHFCMFA